MLLEGIRSKKERLMINRFYKSLPIFAKPNKIVIRGLKREKISGCYYPISDEIHLERKYRFSTLLHENLHKGIRDLKQKSFLPNVKNLRLIYTLRFLEEILVTYIAETLGSKLWVFTHVFVLCYLLATSVFLGYFPLSLIWAILGVHTLFLLVIGLYVSICYIPRWVLDYKLAKIFEYIESEDKRTIRE